METIKRFSAAAARKMAHGNSGLFVSVMNNIYSSICGKAMDGNRYVAISREDYHDSLCDKIVSELTTYGYDARYDRMKIYVTW